MNTDKIYAESIAKEYAPKESSRIVALRKLDRKARRPALVFAWVFGVATTLLAGTGMCFAMEVLGGTLPLTVMGIVLGILGFTGAGVNYPIYKRLLEKGKKKYAFEIVELAREISEEK